MKGIDVARNKMVEQKNSTNPNDPVKLSDLYQGDDGR